MQGCWSFPLIAHYAMLNGTRTAHTMQLDLLLASHFLNKACECHCPATVFSDFMQGCWSFPLIAYYAMLKGTRTAHTMQLDLLLASHFWTRLASAIVLPQSFLILCKAVDLSLSLHTMQCWRGQEQPIPGSWIYCLLVTFWTRLASAIVLPHFFCFYARLLIFPSHCTLCNAEGDKNSPYHAAGFTAC